MIVTMGEEELRKLWPKLITIKEKGYPIKDATYYVKLVKDRPVGHICYKDMGNWYFIGNSYVQRAYRGQGIYDELMTVRNNDLNNKPKIAILIPIENSNLDRLEDRITQRGYERVDNFLDVYGILTFLEYVKYRNYNLWKLGERLAFLERIF